MITFSFYLINTHGFLNVKTKKKNTHGLCNLHVTLGLCDKVIQFALFLYSKSERKGIFLKFKENEKSKSFNKGISLGFHSFITSKNISAKNMFYA